jgi:hypothetical protein
MSGEFILVLLIFICLLGMLYLLRPKRADDLPRFTTPHRNGQSRD